MLDRLKNTWYQIKSLRHKTEHYLTQTRTITLLDYTDLKSLLPTINDALFHSPSPIGITLNTITSDAKKTDHLSCQAELTIPLHFLWAKIPFGQKKLTILVEFSTHLHFDLQKGSLAAQDPSLMQLRWRRLNLAALKTLRHKIEKSIPVIPLLDPDTLNIPHWMHKLPITLNTTEHGIALTLYEKGP